MVLCCHITWTTWTEINVKKMSVFQSFFMFIENNEVSKNGGTPWESLWKSAGNHWIRYTSGLVWFSVSGKPSFRKLLGNNVDNYRSQLSFITVKKLWEHKNESAGLSTGWKNDIIIVSRYIDLITNRKLSLWFDRSSPSHKNCRCVATILESRLRTTVFPSLLWSSFIRF